MARDWSEAEVTAIVADYLSMLADDLAGRLYNKTEHRKALSGQLDGRTKGSIEFKHANISAWMLENGLPYVDGYRPRFNYQALIGDVAKRLLALAPDLQAAIVKEAHALPMHAELLPRPLMMVAAPTPVAGSSPTKKFIPSGLPDFVAIQEANHILGNKGEQAVLEYEKRTLHDLGRKDLSLKVEWVAQTRGPTAGYDILSFRPTGEAKHVEVKTTNFGIYAPFYLSAHELECSQQMKESYVLCRLFDFSRHGRMFELSPPLAKYCKLQPTQYRATFAV